MFYTTSPDTKFPFAYVPFPYAVRMAPLSERSKYLKTCKRPQYRTISRACNRQSSWTLLRVRRAVQRRNDIFIEHLWRIANRKSHLECC